MTNALRDLIHDFKKSFNGNDLETLFLRQRFFFRTHSTDVEEKDVVSKIRQIKGVELRCYTARAVVMKDDLIGH